MEEQVIKELKKRGKSYEWAEWAIKQIDFAHYSRKYTAPELADVMIAYEHHFYV